MRDALLIIFGVLALILAGYGVTAYRSRRHRVGDLQAETTRARRAIALAEASRDAESSNVPDAERLLTRAQAMLSHTTDPATASKAASLAERADRMWQRQNSIVRTIRTDKSTPTQSISAPGFDRADILKIVCVVAIALIGLIFISKQTQQPDVTFKPREVAKIAPGSIDIATPPTYSQIEAQYGDEPIVTLPGATAAVDADVALEWIEKVNATVKDEDKVSRIVLAPPLPPSAKDSIDVPDDVILVTGTRAALSPYVAYPTTFPEMQRIFGSGDVTGMVVELLATRGDLDDPVESFEQQWRDPTAEELAPVVEQLTQNPIAFVDGVTPFPYPKEASAAFGEDIDPLIVVAPPAALGEPAVNYADAIAEAFPDRPVASVTGLWVEFSGQYADEFEAVFTANFYGQFSDRLQRHAYSQENVLRVALNRVTLFRYSGIFSKPLPFQAPDPLNLTMPALPWVCGGLGLAALIALMVQIRRTKSPEAKPVTAEQLTRLAGLSELAVEVSGLTDGGSKAALVRALAALSEARDVCGALDDDTDVAETLLNRAERELATIAEALDRTDYQPTTFLRGRWA